MNIPCKHQTQEVWKPNKVWDGGWVVQRTAIMLSSKIYIELSLRLFNLVFHDSAVIAVQ